MYPMLTSIERHLISLYLIYFIRAYSQIHTARKNQSVIRMLRSEFWIFGLKPLVNCHNSLSSSFKKKKKIHKIKKCRHCPQNVLSSLDLLRTMGWTSQDLLERNFTERACLIAKGYVCIIVFFSTKAVHLK